MTLRRLYGFFFKRKIRSFISLLVLISIIAEFLRLLSGVHQPRTIYSRNELFSSPQLHLGFVQGMAHDKLHWRADSLSTERHGAAETARFNVSMAEESKHPRKFIFAFRYYEQLGRATENLLDLCSLAAYGGREIVAPYVNNSRMSGLRYGVVHHYNKKRRRKSFGPFQTYFDLQQVNDKLRSSGYGTLTSFADMARSCNHRLNILVHFLYAERTAITDTASWYQIREKDIKDIYLRARRNNGWTNCPQIRKSDLDKQLGGFKISRYLCVDPESVRSLQRFEDEILQGANCVGIVQWKGAGPGRTHFPLASTINTELYPFHFQHNAQLVNLAKMFIEKSGIGKHFISVHVRAERHIKLGRGENVTRHCVRKLASRVEKLRKKHNWNVYLASDIVDHGSDTLSKYMGKKQRLNLYTELHKILNYPFTLSAIDGLHDRGAIAIIEMHILAAGRKLVTLGGGNYQEWIVKLFSQNVRDTSHSLHRVCEVRGTNVWYVNN